jgi:hypothetical protein
LQCEHCIKAWFKKKGENKVLHKFLAWCLCIPASMTICIGLTGFWLIYRTRFKQSSTIKTGGYIWEKFVQKDWGLYFFSANFVISTNTKHTFCWNYRLYNDFCFSSLRLLFSSFYDLTVYNAKTTSIFKFFQKFPSFMLVEKKSGIYESKILRMGWGYVSKTAPKLDRAIHEKFEKKNNENKSEKSEKKKNVLINKSY